MSYQVLARKYRSQSFDQMVGQNHVSQTLLNALRNDRLPHALLFTGIRGTGKTSSARILAKSIRCPQAVNFVPCGACVDCVEIATGKSVNVIEIDGASNNGVDAIRDLRDSVMFSPSSGRYKVFIIDEVHMLSTSAFNALLKTLEEPPAHVVFIMATTEVQKIPQTILSRCQRFDFRRIPIKQLADHLKFICREEKIAIDDKAVWMIARQGDGSARDSLSLLDQVINFSSALQGETISENLVSDILGLTSRALLFSAFEFLLRRQSAAMVDLLQKISQTTVNPTLFFEELLRLLRHAILLKSHAPESVLSTDFIDLPVDEIGLLQSLIEDLSLPDLHMLFDMGLKGAQDVARAFDPLLVLEISLLRISQAPQIYDIQALIAAGASGGIPATSVPKPVEQLSAQTPLAAQLKKPARAPETSAKTRVPANEASESNEPTPKPRPTPPPAPETKPSADTLSPVPHVPDAVLSTSNLVPQTSKQVPREQNLVPRTPSKDAWYDFVQYLKTADSILAAKIENFAFGQFLSETKTIGLELGAIFGFLAAQIQQTETRQKLQGFIDSFFGAGYTFQIRQLKATTVESAHHLSQKKELAADEKIRDSWQQDPRIKKAQEVFNGTIKAIDNN